MGLRGTIGTMAARLRAATPDVAQAIGVVAAEITASARSQWPVKTGRSRAALVSYVAGDRAVIRDGVGYALAIRSDGVSPWVVLIEQPVRAAGKRRLPKAIGAAILRALGRG